MILAALASVSSALRPSVHLNRRAALAGGSLALLSSRAASLPCAAYEKTICDENPAKCRSSGFGEFAKLSLDLGGEEADAVARNQLGSATGPKSYAASFDAMDEGERAALLGKLDAATARWKRMRGQVEKALSASTPAYPVAQSALDNAMNQVKGDMRTVSKALSGGDITVRDLTKGGVDQPQFDYNTGQFTLAPMPALAEEVFKVVNELYFAGIKARASPAVGLARLEEADRKFDEWLMVVQQALKLQARS